MEWKEITVFAGLAVTLALGLCNLVWIIVHGRRTIFINTVTSERVKWIGKLRENLSKFTGRTHSWLAIQRDASPKVEEIKGELDVLRYEIKLQLNPGADPDKEIIQKINEIPDLASQSDLKPTLDAMNELVSLGQTLLGTEWRKVKREAQRGALADQPSLLERLNRHWPIAFVPSGVIIAGLLLTVVGAGIAAKGVIMNKSVATELASTKWDLNEGLRRSLIQQSRDARNGLILVAIGSLIQIGGICAQLMSDRESAK